MCLFSTSLPSIELRPFEFAYKIPASIPFPGRENASRRLRTYSLRYSFPPVAASLLFTVYTYYRAAKRLQGLGDAGSVHFSSCTVACMEWGQSHACISILMIIWWEILFWGAQSHWNAMHCRKYRLAPTGPRAQIAQEGNKRVIREASVPMESLPTRETRYNKIHMSKPVNRLNSASEMRSIVRKKLEGIEKKYSLKLSGREREREKSIFCRGYRYTLRDQDTTWPAAYI